MDLSSSERQPTVLIVGSGPSGCYTAQFVRKTWTQSEITIMEALPVPYGLVRYGVAPDHQGAKAVTAQFDRLFEREGVRFVGNVRAGVDVSFEALTRAFDVVVLATGLWRDRGLGIPQDPAARVVGAGRLMRLLNGYPSEGDDSTLEPLGDRVAIVGNGNVAMDIVRLLAKSPDEFDGSDIDDGRLSRVRPEPVSSIDVVGRSSAAQAKFDLAVLREIGHLKDAVVRLGRHAVADADQDSAVIDLLRSLEATTAARAEGAGATTVTFHFDLRPTSIGQDRDATTFLAVDPDGVPTEFRVDSIVTAVGFAGTADDEPAIVSEPNVWLAGWLRRAGRGTMAENRRDSKDVVDSIRAAYESGAVGASKPGLDAIWPQIREIAVEFDGWRRIDEHERATASAGRCRRKITRVPELLRVSHSSRASSVG